VSNISTVTPRNVADSLVAAFVRPAADSPPAAGRDLSMSQLRLLYVLRHEGPLAMGRIAELYEVGHAGATGLVERIERHGLVERRHRADDRRMVECHLTEAGASLLDELAGFHHESLERTLSVLAPDELAQLDHLIQLIATRSQEPE
jgi:DNA-binding MarR family transcriptional regulator